MKLLQFVQTLHDIPIVINPKAVVSVEPVHEGAGKISESKTYINFVAANQDGLCLVSVKGHYLGVATQIFGADNAEAAQ